MAVSMYGNTSAMRAQSMLTTDMQSAAKTERPNYQGAGMRESTEQGMDKVSISQVALETSRAVNGTAKDEKSQECKHRKSLIPDVHDYIKIIKEKIQERNEECGISFLS